MKLLKIEEERKDLGEKILKIRIGIVIKRVQESQEKKNSI